VCCQKWQCVVEPAASLLIYLRIRRFCVIHCSQYEYLLPRIHSSAVAISLDVCGVPRSERSLVCTTSNLVAAIADDDLEGQLVYAGVVLRSDTIGPIVCFSVPTWLTKRQLRICVLAVSSRQDVLLTGRTITLLVLCSASRRGMVLVALPQFSVCFVLVVR